MCSEGVIMEQLILTPGAFYRRGGVLMQLVDLVVAFDGASASTIDCTFITAPHNDHLHLTKDDLDG